MEINMEKGISNVKKGVLIVKKEKIFYFCIILWIVFSVFLGRTTITERIKNNLLFYTYGRYLVYVILCLLLCFDTYKKTSFISIIISASIFLVSAFLSREKVVISVLLFCIASKYAKPKKVVKYFLITHLLIVTFTMILSSCGIISENLMHRGEIARLSYGFSHPNAIGVEMLVILLSYFYLRQQKIRWIDYILWIIILIWFFDRTNCKTTIIVAVLFLISFFITNFFNSKKLHQRIYWFSNIILITVVASSLYLTFFFDEQNRFMKKIDILLSFRPTIMFQAYQNFGISLFGHHVDLNMVDNSFIRLLLLNGLLFFCLYIIFLCVDLRYFYKRRDTIGLLIMTAMILTGFCENVLFRMEYNFPLMLAANYMFMNIVDLDTGRKIQKERNSVDVKSINRAQI